MTAQHTPLPWQVSPERLHNEDERLITSDGPFGPVICGVWPHGDDFEVSPEREANTALIVRAVNSHADLVAALTDMVRFFDSVRPGGRVLKTDADVDAARAALAKAGAA